MKTLNESKIRALAIMTAILGCILLSIDLENSSVFVIFAIIICLGWLSNKIYSDLKDKEKKEINDILGITWLEKKTGLNFNEE